MVDCERYEQAVVLALARVTGAFACVRFGLVSSSILIACALPGWRCSCFPGKKRLLHCQKARPEMFKRTRFVRQLPRYGGL